MKNTTINNIVSEAKRAIREHNKELLKDLLDQGLDVNARDEYSSLLHFASSIGELEVINLLLEQPGAKVDITDDMSTTPLFNAALLEGMSCLDVTKRLLDAGANPKTKDINGFTALHLAASRGNIKLLELLINKGADINTTSDYGTTLIHSAAFGVVRRDANYNKCWEAMSWIFKHKFNLGLLNIDEISVTNILAKNDYSDVEQYEQLLGELSET